MQLYLVTAIYYDTTKIVGVFPTPDAASAAIDQVKSWSWAHSNDCYGHPASAHGYRPRGPFDGFTFMVDPITVGDLMVAPDHAPAEGTQLRPTLLAPDA